MNKIKKVTGRFLSLILAAAMCVSLVPVSNVTALAADGTGLPFLLRKGAPMHILY